MHGIAAGIGTAGMIPGTAHSITQDTVRLIGTGDGITALGTAPVGAGTMLGTAGMAIATGMEMAVGASMPEATIGPQVHQLIAQDWPPTAMAARALESASGHAAA